MNRTERLYRIDQLLHERRVVGIDDFLAELDVSRATFKRDMEYLRDRLHAPIVWDRDAGGYRFDHSETHGPAYELPGLWFSAAELHALLAAHKLLADIEPGILSAHITPLQARLSALMEASGHRADDITRRVRLLSMAKRRVEPRYFAEIATALLERKRLTIDAWNRGRNETNRRTISPQRLVHYRDNWYLDAWCHWREGLRSFALDTLQSLSVTPDPANEVADAELDAHYTSAYGIFAGQPTDWAVLRFSPERARWVRAERWHADQRAEDLLDGGYRLHVPFADPRELVMDILRHGAHVVVEAPPSLRDTIATEARQVLAHYD